MAQRQYKLSQEMRLRIRHEYQTGKILLNQLYQKYPQIPRPAVREAAGPAKPAKQASIGRVSFEEAQQRRESIRLSWSQQESRLRWVGRYVLSPESMDEMANRLN